MLFHDMVLLILLILDRDLCDADAGSLYNGGSIGRWGGYGHLCQMRRH
jgi:hypothetical protein